MMYCDYFTPSALLVLLSQYLRRKPVLRRDDIDRDPVEFGSDSEDVRSLVCEIKTTRGTIVSIL
jgi:hypothetical protein